MNAALVPTNHISPTEKEEFLFFPEEKSRIKSPLGLACSLEGIRGLSNIVLGIQDKFSLQV